MPQKPLLERSFSEAQRAIKRLWENVSAVNSICRIASRKDGLPHGDFPCSFQNLFASSSKELSRTAARDSAKNISDAHLWAWCLIVGIAHFDAWLEDAVTEMHSRFPNLIVGAKAKKYNFTTPSFNREFFKNDKGALGLVFTDTGSDEGRAVIAKMDAFIRWKEARNCLVHKGGSVTHRYAMLFNPPLAIDKRLKLTPSDARDALKSTLELMKEIQRQMRRKTRALAK